MIYSKKNYDAQLATIMQQIAYDSAGIYGAAWDKSSNPVLTRTDNAVFLEANAGTDSIKVNNKFDACPLFKDFADVTDAYGNVFVRVPKIYLKRQSNNGCETVQASRTMFTGAYLPWCFWDFTNNVELPYIDIGKYKASLSGDDKLESKINTYPLINKNIVDFRTYARANNVGAIKGYQQLDIHAVDLIQALFTIEFATLNSQNKVAGYTNGQYTNTHLATVAENGVNRIIVSSANAALYNVGQTISIGTSQGGNEIFYGRQITSINVYDGSNKAISFDGAPVNIAIGNMLYNTGAKSGFSANIASSVGSKDNNLSGKFPFVWHGIESIFGDLWQFTDGVNINERQAWVAKNADDYASNVFASPYLQLGYINGSMDGYASNMGFDTTLPFARFPVAVGGSSTTYYSDYYYSNAGQRIARVGGYWNSGSNAGLSSWSLNVGSSVTGADVGGRLVRKAAL